MNPRRFKVDDLSQTDIRHITVTGGEADHALKVLRMDKGAELVLFDGSGREITGRIASTGPSRLEVEVIHRHDSTPDEAPQLTIAVAAPKANRADGLVEKCGELGVETICLLRTQRGEVVPGEGKVDRWRRKVVSAAKQARVLRTTTIEPPRTIEEVARATPSRARLWYGDPDLVHPVFVDVLCSLGPPESCDVIFIGPEGGFTDAEQATIESRGGRPVRLAESILRIETAAITAAAQYAAWRISAR